MQSLWWKVSDKSRLHVLIDHAVSFGSPMVSSPDVFSKFQREDFVDIDLVKDNNIAGTAEYASDIFSYLREAEVLE
jgi:hypothetical protein